jgi:DMSO/TMAO reductase YedYZ molybdopterin-dependent catalytic subunit
MFEQQRERRALENRVREEGRLPPGQSATLKFPVLHYGPVPRVNLETWDFRVFGLVEEEKRWTWEEFNQLPRTKVTLDIHCVTRWSKFDTEWEGVSVKTLVEEGIIKPLPEAQYVIQHCEYNYTTNTPLAFVLQPGFVLATHYNGEPLELEHGYPLRGVAGVIAGQRADDKYFWKGGKWLRALEFRAEDQKGFWERNGYHNEADIWKEQRHGWFF